MQDDLISVMIPKRHLAKVYGLVAELEAVQTEQHRPAPATEPTAAEGWTPAQIRVAVQQSPPAMRDILRALANRAGEWLSTHDLARAIRDNPQADWKTVAGTLGAFGRRISSRYQLQSLPFEGRYDHGVGCRVHRMSAETAREVVQVLNEN